MFAIREPTPADLAAIVRLYEADAIGGHDDAWSPDAAERYAETFAAIAASDANVLRVATEDDAVVGVFQLVLFRTLTRQGALRAKLAGVQVREDCRSRGIGAGMIAEAEAIARARGATAIELSSSTKREHAHRFYRRLGYEPSHAGFRKVL